MRCVDLLLRQFAHLQVEPQVVAHGHVRIERVALEDHRHVAIPRRDIGHVRPRSEIVPELTGSRPAIMRSVVVLPQPEGPSSVKNSPSRISR